MNISLYDMLAQCGIVIITFKNKVRLLFIGDRDGVLLEISGGKKLDTMKSWQKRRNIIIAKNRVQM